MSPSVLPLVLARVSYAAGPVCIIEDVSVALSAGVRSVILGANGAGKSVLLRLCHGLLRPTSGTISWQGPYPADPARRQAMVFQRPVMLRRSALANVALGLKLARVGARDRAARARQALQRVGLDAIAQRAARVLSGGEQQPLPRARSSAREPDVLFLDEPTAKLDPTATRTVEEIIAAIHRDGAKIVMTTHNLGLARRFADEILFLHRGRLVERAPADRFFFAPATPEAAAFLKEELPW
ncbi:MAG: ATP-binding cassette domain-containing protein [Pseudomonadota bacterium]